MEEFENALCPTEARTPEPQRLHPGTRGSHARAVGHPHAFSELDRYDGTSRAQQEGGANAFRTFSTDAWLQGQGEPDPKALRTPPTISRNNWLQLQAHVGEAHQLRSPPSFAPTAEGAPALHNTGRRLSCPSANRSVAPARYSIEYNMMGSGRRDSSCRHTTLLTNISGLHDTPLSRASAAGARAIRPTVLLPATSGASGGDVLWEGGRCFGPVDGDASVRESAFDRYCGGRASADPSVPLLTRFSCGSHDGGGGRGAMSPGVRSGMGRPTTLRCAEFDVAASSQWDGGRCNADDEEEPWLGGTTQVWRNSGELTMGPAVATQRSAFPNRGGETRREDCCREEVEGEEEGVVVRAARATHGGAYSNSPEVVWRPMALAAGAASAWPSVSQAEAPLFAQYSGGGRAEESSGATDDSAPHCGDLPDDADASLTGLCDAPRKSYVRSTTHSPLRGNGVSDAQRVMCASQDSTTTAASTMNAHWGAVDPRCSTQAEGRHSDDALTAPHHGQRQCYPLSVVTAVATAASANSANTQENWVFRGASTPQGRPAMSCVPPTTAMGPTTNATRVHATVASSASAAATAAEAVAAQLARLSLQASPTQKRLAFEDDEEDGLVDDISDGQTPASPTNAFAAVRSGRTDGGNVGSSCGVRGGGRGAGATASTRWASGGCGGGRGVCLSGLQLLRSRKRCLEEMQATDLEPPNNAAGLAGVAGGQSAGTAVLSGMPLEDLKRQRKEGRVAHLQDEGNAEEALIPAPQRPDVRAAPRAAASSCPPQLGTSSSSSFSSQKWSQPPQPVLGPHGEAKSWSQLSSISYVTPTSQSISIGMAAVLGGGSQSQREGCAVGATACPSAPCSQVLSSLPTNVSQRHQSFKP